MAFEINNNNPIDKTSTEYVSPNAVKEMPKPSTNVGSSHQHFSLSSIVSRIKQFFISIRRSNFEFLEGIKDIPLENLSPIASKRLASIEGQMTKEGVLKTLYLDKGSKLVFNDLGDVANLLDKFGKKEIASKIRNLTAIGTTLPIKKIFEYQDTLRFEPKRADEVMADVTRCIEERRLNSPLAQERADAVAVLAILKPIDSEDVVKKHIENIEAQINALNLPKEKGDALIKEKTQEFCKGFVETYKLLDELGLVPTKLNFVKVMEDVVNGKGSDQLKKSLFSIEQLRSNPTRRAGARTPEAIEAKNASKPQPQNNYDNVAIEEQAVEAVTPALSQHPEGKPKITNSVPTPPPAEEGNVLPPPPLDDVPPPTALRPEWLEARDRQRSLKDRPLPPIPTEENESTLSTSGVSEPGKGTDTASSADGVPPPPHVPAPELPKPNADTATSGAPVPPPPPATTPPPVPNSGVEGVPPPPPPPAPNTKPNAGARMDAIDQGILDAARGKLKKASDRVLPPEPLTPRGQTEPKWNPNMEEANLLKVPVQLVPDVDAFKAKVENPQWKNHVVPRETPTIPKKETDPKAGIRDAIKKGVSLKQVDREKIESEKKAREDEAKKAAMPPEEGMLRVLAKKIRMQVEPEADGDVSDGGGDDNDPNNFEQNFDD